MSGRLFECSNGKCRKKIKSVDLVMLYQFERAWRFCGKYGFRWGAGFAPVEPRPLPIVLTPPSAGRRPCLPGQWFLWVPTKKLGVRGPFSVSCLPRHRVHKVFILPVHFLSLLWATEQFLTDILQCFFIDCFGLVVCNHTFKVKPLLKNFSKLTRIAFFTELCTNSI